MLTNHAPWQLSPSGILRHSESPVGQGNGDLSLYKSHVWNFPLWLLERKALLCWELEPGLVIKAASHLTWVTCSLPRRECRGWNAMNSMGEVRHSTKSNSIMEINSLSLVACWATKPLITFHLRQAWESLIISKEHTSRVAALMKTLQAVNSNQYLAGQFTMLAASPWRNPLWALTLLFSLGNPECNSPDHRWVENCSHRSEFADFQTCGHGQERRGQHCSLPHGCLWTTSSYFILLSWIWEFKLFSCFMKFGTTLKGRELERYFHVSLDSFPYYWGQTFKILSVKTTQSGWRGQMPLGKGRSNNVETSKEHLFLFCVTFHILKTRLWIFILNIFKSKKVML